MTRDSTLQALQLLGAYTEDGRRKPLDYQEVCAPTEVEIVGDQLVWSPGFLSYKRLPEGKQRLRAERNISEKQTWRYRDASPEMLLQFSRLSDGSPEAIKAYALRWGVLSLCKHWLPSSHSSMCSARRVPKRLYVYSEPIAAWHHFAKQAKALIANAIAVRENRPPNLDDVDVVSERIDNVRRGKTYIPPRKLPPAERKQHQEWLLNYLDEATKDWDEDMRVEFWTMFNKVMSEPPNLPYRLQGHRNALSSHINTWLGLGNVRPQLNWTERGPRIEFGVGSAPWGRLFGHLALQLLLTVSGSSGFVICSSCAEPYVATRVPAAGRLHFCKQCGIKEAWKLAQRRLRAKRRS